MGVPASPQEPTVDGSRRPKRHPLLGAAAAALILAALAAAVWWLGPWSAGFRYQRMDLVHLRRLLDDQPNNAPAWRQLGLRLAADGDPLAEEALRRALALRPTDPQVGTGLGELLYATHRYPEAFQVLKATLAHHPRYALAHMALGRLYQQKGSYLHAATEYEAAVAADPTLSDGWYRLAVCYLQTQQAAKAENAIARARKLAPSEPEYMALEGSVDAAIGKVDEGIAVTKRAAELAPRNVRIQSNLVNMLLASHRGPDDLTLAEQTIGHVEQIAPDYPLLAYQRGELERQRQNWPAAARYLERAVQASPGQDEVYFALSQTYRRLNHPKEADRMEAIYRRHQALRLEMDNVRVALGADSNNPKLYEQLAGLQFALGDRSGAANSLQEALRIDPKAATARAKLTALERMGVDTSQPQP